MSNHRRAFVQYMKYILKEEGMPFSAANHTHGAHGQRRLMMPVPTGSKQTRTAQRASRALKLLLRQQNSCCQGPCDPCMEDCNNVTEHNGTIYHWEYIYIHKCFVRFLFISLPLQFHICDVFFSQYAAWFSCLPWPNFLAGNNMSRHVSWKPVATQH